MAEKKRKGRSQNEHSRGRDGMKRKRFPSKKKKNEQRKTGPRLPSVLRKEIELLNPKPNNSDEVIDSDEGELGISGTYEYEERSPEEESKKNRRFDPVDNLEYELPDEFEDENLPSDDDDIGGEYVSENKGKRDSSNHSGDEADEEDDGRHSRMLQGITGMPSDVFEGKKSKKNVVVSEAYPESEFNPSRDALEGESRLSIQDLLDPLHGKPGYSKLRKRMHQLEKKAMSVQAPLPKADQEKMERKAAYEISKKDITKWEPLVKRNREAPTIYFDEDINLGFSTVGAIASEFEPRTDFEKKIASLVHDANIVEAHRKDGSRLLELNMISLDDVKERQNRLAKMRSLLFRHELKAKHIKKIKSKTYHRLLKKDKLKATSSEMLTDPEAVKEHAMKQEFKRAEERMTLKHKNSSRWAKRILKRGLNAQDEGTRAAISEQLHQHALLSRKMNSMKDSGSSDDSSYDDDEDEPSLDSDQDKASILLEKAKEKTLKVMQEEDEVPTSGVLSLPFMVRGLKKRKEAAYEEANLALQEYDSSLRQLENMNGAESPKIASSSGRRVFGLAMKQSQERSNKIDSNNGRISDSDDDLNAKEEVDMRHDKTSTLLRDAHIDHVSLPEEHEGSHSSVFKSVNDTARDPGRKTTYEVAIFAPDSVKKTKSGNDIDSSGRKSKRAKVNGFPHQDPKEEVENSDSETEEEMVDGIISAGAKPNYELPSQAELIHRAFAGDDVEEEFEKDKQEVLNEENPEPEKPILLPGWGQWTHIQQKKGMPSWMLEEHEKAKKNREDATKKRKDAHLKNVIISERMDKKAEKLHTKALPYPYTSKEVFEQSIRMPIGPEFNPASSVGALNRPEVVKKPGVIIKPIKFEEVNPHEKVEDNKQTGQAKKRNKNRSNSGKIMKKVKT